MKKIRSVMIKSGLQVFSLLLILCLSGLLAHAQAQLATPSPLKRELARSVLIEAGIPAEYDRYLRNAVELGAGPGWNAKLIDWMQQIMAEDAGWKHVEAQYTSQLEANFSQAELEELQALLKQPLFQKLLKVDAQTYLEVSQKRKSLLGQVWENYQLMKYKPPSGL